MAFVSSKEMVKDACRNQYAIGAFPAHNWEMIKAIIEAAEELREPVILQTTPSTIRYFGMEQMVSMVKTEAENSKVPVCLHLDHGDNLKTVHQCVRGGYTSIMIDGSHLEFEANIRLVNQTVQLCHDVGLPVEAELGSIGMAENMADQMSGMTDPLLAEEFVRRTHIDFLAASFGTAHGQYVQKPNLDFARLAEISKGCQVPIVMHGASGIADEDLQRAIHCGVSKINFSTELKHAFVNELRGFLNENPLKTDPRKYFLSARQAVKEIVKEKLTALRPARNVV